ncbi:MAG: PAS domain S-box protein [Rhodospirillaceae bacterium]|nr:PAS domain S-box protein [Rhodospirillaceae bacterium]
MRKIAAGPADPTVGPLRRLLGSAEFLDLLPIGVYCCNREGIIRRYNRRAVAIWGQAPRIGDRHEDFCAKQKLFDLDGRPIAPAETPMAEVLRSGVAQHDREVVVERPDGTRVTALINIDPLFGADGVAVGAVNCFQDVTKLAEAEDRQRDSERRLRDILEALPVAIYTTDAAGKVTYFNRAAAEMTGRLPQLEKDRWCVAWRLLRLDGSPLAKDACPLAIALREGRSVPAQEMIVERPDGGWIRVAPHPVPLFDRHGRLAGAVNMLQDVSAMRRGELEAAHLAAIVSSSNDAIVSKSLEGRVRTWNAGAERMFGYTPQEMIGQPITRIIPPELHGEEEGILARLRRGERIEHFETERMTKDGRRIDVSLSVSPVRDASGTVVGASKVARDVTERKRAEEMQRLLVRELDHRVKNTLAMVHSIAQQTARTTEGRAEFVAIFTGRLDALAHTHDLLTRNSWRGADLFALLRDQLLLGGADDERIVLAGPAVALSPQQALHLALVLHELGVNARKYGALSATSGRLSITWTVSGQSPRKLLLLWQETGGPPVQAPTRKGFGTSLIAHGLAGHGGETSLHFRPGGVACDIVLPLSEADGRNERPSADAAARPDLPQAAASASARRILVVDDEPLIALDVVDALKGAGFAAVGPAANLGAALALIAAEKIDAALLDANLGGQPVDEIAAALTRSNIPFAFMTGYGRDGLPQAFRQAPVIAKPFGRDEAVAMAVRLTEEKSGIVRLLSKGA